MNHLLFLRRPRQRLARSPADRPDVRRGLAAPDRPDHQLRHRLRCCSTYSPTSAILQVLEERRQHIAEGLANAEKIKAELARTEAAAAGSHDPGQRPGDQADRGSPRRRRPRAGAGNAKGHRRRRADHRQGARSRRRRTTPACWPNCAAKSAGWSCRPPATVTGKILTPDDQQRLAEETSRQLAA